MKPLGRASDRALRWPAPVEYGVSAMARTTLVGMLLLAIVRPHAS
jgi:hypothetical protein